MSDDAFNNWGFARFIEKFGKENPLKDINKRGTFPLPNPTEVDWEAAGNVTREPDYIRKVKKIRFNGPFLDTTRPTPPPTPEPTPPVQTLVIFRINDNICGVDQQICGLDYYI